MGSPDSPKVTTQHALIDATGAVVGPLPAVNVKPADPDPKRKLPFDLTGMYEAVPEHGQNSKCMVHLNQFGRAVVGWLSSPLKFVDTGGRFGIEEAVFIGSLEDDDKADRGYRFWPVKVEDSSAWDPTAVLSPTNPWNKDNPPADVNWGRFEIKGNRIEFHFEKPVRRELVVERVNASTRMSSRATMYQIDSLKRVLLARQRHPTPSSFFDISKPSGAVWQEYLARFAPDGQIAQFVKIYVDPESGRARKKFAVDSISNLLKFPWDGSDQEPYLNLLLVKQIMAQDTERPGLSIGGGPGAPELDPNGIPTGGHGEPTPPETMSILEWLSKIAVNERHVENRRAEVPANFEKVLVCSVVYRYTMTFASTVLASPPYPLSAAVGFFDVGISVSAATRGPDGNPGPFTPVDGGVAGFTGAFMEFKAGLADPPELPSELEMYSGEYLDPHKHFRGATFTIASIEAGISVGAGGAAPIAKVGGKVKVVGGKTQIMQLHLNGKHLCLEGVFDDATIKPSLKWDNKIKLDWDKIEGIAEKGDEYTDGLAPSYPKKKHLSDPKAAHKYIQAGVSLGAGLLIGGYDLPVWRRPAPIIEEHSERAATDARTVCALFKYDKSDLLGPLNGWSRLFLFEVVMATEAALFDGFPYIEMRGFSSPEGPRGYNQRLSQKRANTMMQKVRDVKHVPDGLWKAIGLGELGHDPDPENDPVSARIWKEEHFAEKAMWWQNRKVELWARGQAAVRMLTVVPKR
ncbi:hypothetical protein LZC95_08185 [Pendulispora brunnea]|uniref:Uncharacterized protein n=1 Tax=Pendulispora brunnea TaxID=2905690 RepID=A0ABZ2KFH4_9BACT